MAHIPHLFVPAPWSEDHLTLDSGQVDHLRKVLRREDRSPVSYTDGAGSVGGGFLQSDRVVRDAEHYLARGERLVRLAVAPPRSRDRVRVIVEKLAEMGVAELIWLATTHGRGRPPNAGKARAWAVSALEQSRGAWLMEVSGPKTLSELHDGMLVADPDGGSLEFDDAATSVLLAIGPEGGWESEEVPDSARRVALSDRILRTETAAIVGAARLLEGLAT